MSSAAFVRRSYSHTDRSHTLVYVDPPYWGTEGCGVEFGLDQYALMAEAMASMKSRAAVSVNDIPEMREVFKGFPMREVSINCSVGGARRPGRRRGS